MFAPSFFLFSNLIEVLCEVLKSTCSSNSYPFSHHRIHVNSNGIFLVRASSPAGQTSASHISEQIVTSPVGQHGKISIRNNSLYNQKFTVYNQHNCPNSSKLFNNYQQYKFIWTKINSKILKNYSIDIILVFYSLVISITYRCFFQLFLLPLTTSLIFSDII